MNELLNAKAATVDTRSIVYAKKEKVRHNYTTICAKREAKCEGLKVENKRV